MSILILAELAGGKLRNSTLNAITMAQRAAEVLATGYDILVVGGVGAAAAAEALSRYGAGKVLLCEEAKLEHYLAELYAPTVANAAKPYQLLVATATSSGKDLMPRVAARLDAPLAADVVGVLNHAGKLAFKRPMFAGNAFAHVALSGSTQLATVRQSEFPAAAATSTRSPIEPIAYAAPGDAAARVSHVALEQVKSERPELGDARVVVSGGRALKDQFFDLLTPLADALGAAIGASRAACDAGYAPGDLQVGQTGKIVAPELYIAIGISGAIQHIAGMKGSKVIVAINKDAEAPIFQIADYGLVTDLFEAIPKLVEAIKARKPSP